MEIINGCVDNNALVPDANTDDGSIYAGHTMIVKTAC